MLQTPLKTCKGVSYLSDESPFIEQEGLYLQVRQAEGRLYPDEELRCLPDTDDAHPLASEWRIRARSARRFCRYLKVRRQPLTVIDVGCGNGWMSHLVATIDRTEVIAIDLNRTELEQASRAFGSRPNLSFVYGDVLDGIFAPELFDIVLLAATIQYFPDTRDVLTRLQSLLKSNGEIHILDSPFYTQATIAAAQDRTANYYEELGFPEMSTYYHHPLIDDVASYRPRVAHKPRRLLGRIYNACGFPYVPFPWLIIDKRAELAPDRG